MRRRIDPQAPSILPPNRTSANPIQHDPTQPNPQSPAGSRPPPPASDPIGLLTMLSHVDDQASSQSERSDRAVPRLVITKMTLTNFKSYAGTIIIGPFHKSFTSIVGPNGSGKSNVIDSLLFVFGFKAKKMRQGKLSDLIHSSAAFPNLTSCTVEISFAEIIDQPGTDDFTVIQGSELNISRTVEKTASERQGDKSTYRINGRASSYTEVTSTLKAKGVDLDHNRFLILQGEVESIALMKPKAQSEHDDGLLEYLEDIIGTSRYKKDIEEHAALLDTLNDQRQEKVTKLRIVEKDKNALESRKDEAVAFVNLENELCRKRNALYQFQVYQANQQMNETSLEIEELSMKIEAERQKHKSLEKEIASLEAHSSEFVDAYERLAAEAETTRKQLAKHERAEVEFREKEKHLSQKQKKLQKIVAQERRDIAETINWVRNYDGDRAKIVGQLEELNEQKEAEEAELEEIRSSLEGKTTEIQMKIEEKQKLLAPWQEKHNQHEANLKVAQSEFDMLNQKHQRARGELEQAEESLATFQDTLQKKTVELKGMKKQRADLAKKEAVLQTEMKNLDNQEPKLRATLSDARQQVSEAKSSLSESRSRGTTLSTLNQAAQDGTLPGIFGRLGDLGIIDDKYDVAITTACGALDNIVVDTVETAQKAIELLKRRQAGRGNFMCLDKLAVRDMSSKPTPENAPRLFDLIKPREDRFKVAFYYAVQNTLVAKDMDQAMRIAFPNNVARAQHRVVTLDGNLIETSGTLSGGGRTVRRGGMSSKFVSNFAAGVSQSAVINLEKVSSAAQTQLQGLLDQKKEVAHELGEVTKELPQLDFEISKLEMDISSMTENHATLQKKIPELRQSLKPAQAELSRLAQLDATIQKETAKLSTITASMSKIQEEIKSLQNQILEVGGVRFRAQKGKVDLLEEQIASAMERLAKLEAEKKTREKSLNKLEAGVERKEAELEETGEELAKVVKDLERVSRVAAQVKDKIEEAKQELANKQEELDQIKAELEEKTTTLRSLRTVEFETKARLEAVQEIFAAAQKAEAYYSKELIKLELQVTGFEEEELPSLEQYEEDQLENLDGERLEEDIQSLEDQLRQAKPNLSVLIEYRQKLEIYLSRGRDVDEFTRKRDSAKKVYDDLKKCRLDEFMEGFTQISEKLKEMYQMITMGGNAELELVDSMDPFSEGIIFSVMPPKKSWKNISNLSGGEKTLSSLALVFALHHFKPTPLYVMDEIDAALDFRNVSIVANYIKERTQNAQFVIISLRNNMFELADRLVGIYKTNNTTKSITIDPRLITMPEPSS
ncbi:RecF/RecN/SMC [Polychytrium aggregatum]|uniref:RecF/RecN/SMC n=1 Tax=Polychytrium aggregatum TaxID=110093 RepID=UPI0022FE76F6|nr:RecF/RecN/SMC [Polychytrium aggregatum]KAI9199233.1 RecF/RecN/SMC [Polychytrium aggregatum]